jgi:peptide/nickel transport system substrate-binding protein
MDKPTNLFADLIGRKLSRRQMLAAMGLTAGTMSMAEFLAACQSGTATSSVKKGGSLIIDVQTEPNEFSPIMATSAGYYWIELQVAEPLYTYDDNLKIVPLLTTAAPATTDGLTWTIKLKDKVLFHNGDQFTSEHVVAQITAIMGTLYPGYKSRFTGFDSIKAIDPLTVQLTMKTANYLVPETLALIPMIHKDTLPKTDSIMGTGPFVWTEHRQGDHVKLTTNTKYHLPRAIVDDVTFRFVPDPSTRLVNLLGGSSHMMLLPSFADLPTLQKNSQVKVIQVSSPVVMPTYVNAKKPIFSDVRVRQALGFAMDRTRVRDLAFSGQADIGDGVLPSMIRGFDPNFHFFPAKADSAKAKQLLADAGYGPGGKTPEFTLSLYNVPSPVAAFQVIQQDWQNAGFKVNIELLDLSGWVVKFLAKSFDIIVSYELDGTTWGDAGWPAMTQYRTGDPNNRTGFSDPQFDDLLKQSILTSDTKQQETLWQQANKILSEGAVDLIPVVPKLTGAYRSNLKGVDVSPLKLSLLRLTNISLG